MNTQPHCPSCQKPLAPDGPMGLCPECLVKAGFPSAADTQSVAAAAFVPPTVAELAPLFPQLEILELIGKGGMGAVYKARQIQLNRLVALKILPPDVGHEPAFAARFTREAQALALLNHPGIVTLYEFGSVAATPPSQECVAAAPTARLYFFLMEYVDGVNLRQLLQNGRVSAREALAIVPQICDALQLAHDQGIVHRDIKPENILMDRRGRVKVADFGLAKIVAAGSERQKNAGEEVRHSQPAATAADLTEVGKVMGTPHYMSPEQIAAPGEVDHRADIYALGVVFYQMLTGELPGKRIEAPSKKVHIDVRLDEVVLRALEQKPELRYQQASMLKTQVETIALTPDSARRQGDGSQAEKENLECQSFLRSTPTNEFRISSIASLAAFLLAYFGLLLLLGATADTLPPRVASHFGEKGRPNGWMSREFYLAFTGCLPLLFGGIAVVIPWLVRRVPAQFFNIPRRDYWLTPERRPELAAFLRGRMFWLGGLLTAFFAGLHLLTVHANQTEPPNLSMDGLLALVIAFLISVLIWTVSLVMRLAEVDKPLFSRSNRREGALTEKSAMVPRFSRAAIVGACWTPFFFIALILMFWSLTPVAVPAGSPPPSLPLPALLLGLLLALLGLTAPFGTTILGWVAVSQIRRSAGRLYGLGLAVFDGLLFPLLALDGVVAGMLYWLIVEELHWKLSFFALVTLVVILVLDRLIIRRVWRAVNAPTAGE